MKYKLPIVLAYFKECGLPEPQTEYRFHPVRKWRFDFAWPYEMVDDEPVAPVYLECDGGVFTAGRHTRGAGVIKDQEKRNAATVLGWRGLWCIPSTLCTSDMVDTIKAALWGEEAN